MHLPTIYLPIEIKPREFRAKVLLAQCAAQQGFRVYLGSKLAVDSLLRRKSTVGGIYFYKGGKSEAVLQTIAKKTDHFVVLDEEMGPVVRDLETAYRGRIFPGTERYISKLFVIGERHRNTIKKVRPELYSAVEVTGWPRVDLWKRDFRSQHDTQIEDIEDRFGPFILFASNFGVQTTEKVEKRVETKIAYQSFDSEFIEYHRNIWQESVRDFEAFVQLMIQVDKDPEFPRIVVRPHPAEDIALWQERIGHLEKVHVIYEGDIGGWLHASRGMMHRGCTTALQAFIGGVPSIFVVLPDAVPDQASLSYRASVVAHDYNQLRKLCQSACEGRGVGGVAAAFDEDVFLGPELASDRIIRSLAGLSISSEPSHRSSPAGRWIRLAQGRVRERIASAKSRSVRETLARKLPGGVSSAEVSRVAQALIPEQTLSIMDVDHDLVEIEMMTRS